VGGHVPERRLYPVQSAAAFATHMLHEANTLLPTWACKGKSPSRSTGRRCRPTSRTRSDNNTKGIRVPVKKNKIDCDQRAGATIPEGRQGQVGDEVPRGQEHIHRTGSEPASSPAVEVDETVRRDLHRWRMSLNKVPKKLVVIGAGVIGLRAWVRLPRASGRR